MDDMQVALKLDLKPFMDSLGIAQNESIDFGKNLGKNFDGINVTVKDLLDRLDDLKEKFQNAPIGSEAWHRWKEESQVISNELKKVKDEFNQTSPAVKTSSIQVGAFRTALTESTYALAQINPALGNVASSLSPLISGFNTSAVRGKGFTAMLGAVGSQIMGPAGILIGISLLTTAITTWMKSSDDAGKSTKSLKDEVKSLVSEYENLMRVQISQKLSEWTEKYEEQTKAIKDRLSFWQMLGSIIDLDRGLLGMLGFGDVNDEEIEKLRKLRVEEEALNKALSDKGRIPQLEATIKYMNELKRRLPDSAPQASFDAYNNSIKTLQAELDTLNGKVKDKKKDNIPEEIKFRREHLGLTNEMIRAEIKLIDVRLSDPSYKGDRVQDLKYRIELQKLLTVGAREQIDTFGKLKHLKLNDKFSMDPVDKVPRPEVFKETNEELQRMLDLSDMLTTSFNSAAKAVASAASSGISLFRQENSLLQIFISSLIRATAEAITLKLVTTGLNIIGSLFGLPFLGSAATGIADMAGSGLNKSVTGSGLSGLSSTSSSLSRGSSYNISPIVQQVPIVLDSRIKGKDIFMTQRKQASYRRKYYGAAN